MNGFGNSRTTLTAVRVHADRNRVRGWRWLICICPDPAASEES